MNLPDVPEPSGSGGPAAAQGGAEALPWLPGLPSVDPPGRFWDSPDVADQGGGAPGTP